MLFSNHKLPYNIIQFMDCSSKDHVVATATDKGIVKVVDRVKLSTVASYKESNSSSSGGGGIYSVAVSAYFGGSLGQQPGLGGITGIGGTGPVSGAGGGQPGSTTQYQTFAISSRNSIVILNFSKWQKRVNKFNILFRLKRILKRKFILYKHKRIRQIIYYLG